MQIDIEMIARSGWVTDKSANHKDPEICMEKSQGLMDGLFTWCQENKLTINIIKTKHMFVGRKKEHRESLLGKNVIVEHQPLNNVSRYTYLGVDVDHMLSFDSMVDSIYKKANRKLYTLKLIRPYITNDIQNSHFGIC